MAPSVCGRLGGWTAFVVAGLVVIQQASAQTWTVIDLGLGKGEDINANGQVVGDSAGRGWLWTDGVRTDIGSLDGTSHGWCVAFAINDLGQIVGESRDALYRLRGFLWEDGVMTDLGVLSGTTSRAFEINNIGQVVGRSDCDPSGNHAYLWQGGVMTDLGTLDGSGASKANDINESGQAVGWAGAPSVPDFRAVLWEDGVITDLGTLGSTKSEAFEITESGIVVGYSYTAADERHAFLWQDGVMTDLGTLPGASDSRAWNLNESGQVVGDSGGRAFMWQGGAMIDLNDLIDPNTGWVLEVAYGINDAGQIVGGGTRMGGSSRAFLLNPPPIYALTITIEGGPPCYPYGHVETDPYDPDGEYLAGTEVTLEAVPRDWKVFEHWQIYDPNHPGDANYAAISTDNPIAIVMDADREVTAIFDRGQCGPGVEQMLPVVLLVTGFCGFVSRRRGR